MKEIKNIRDLINDEELVQYIAEDISDISEDTPVTYEVWALGKTINGETTDNEILLGEFSDPDEAIAKAKEISADDITEKYPDVACFSIEVETVINDEEGTMNVGTIYKRALRIDGEHSDEETVSEDEHSEVVPITAKDYTLLEDGSIEVDCKTLKNFNKNDTVQFMFVEETEDITPILTYKIISKTIANKFICEFVY